MSDDAATAPTAEVSQPMQCPNCGQQTPAGSFCVHCGAHLPEGGHALDPRRRRAFAADPREHVNQLSVISTLFPHLDPRRSQLARWLLLGGVVVIFLIGLGRIVPVSLVAAALLVPVLYLLYFYDAKIYEDEPLRVLAATFIIGAVLGIVMSLLLYRAILSQYRFGARPTTGFVLLTGVGLPLLGQALMLVGPLVLFFLRRRFDDLLDGLVFGVASGLGFAAAQSIIYSWQLITGPFFGKGPAYSWALPTIRTALLVPLLDAATTGLICAALWLSRDRGVAARRSGWLGTVPAAVVIAVLGQVIPNIGVDLAGGQILNLVWYAVVIAILVLLLRNLLHLGLLEKARTLGNSGTIICPHCLHRVPDGAFCPHCGIALRSIAKPARRATGQRATGQEEAHA